MDPVVRSDSPHKLSPSQIEKVQGILSSLNVQENEGLGLVALVLALGETVLKQKKQIECMQQKLAIIEAQKENSTSRTIETQHDPIEVQTGCGSLSEIADSKFSPSPKEGPYLAQASEKGQLSDLQTRLNT